MQQAALEGAIPVTIWPDALEQAVTVGGLSSLDQPQGFLHIGLIVVPPGGGADLVPVIHQHVPEPVSNGWPVQFAAHGGAAVLAHGDRGR